MKPLARILFLVLFLCCCVDAFATVDTNYIKKYERQLSLTAFGGVNEKFIWVETGLFNDESTNENSSYQSNMPMVLGVGVSFERLSFSFGFGGLIPNLTDEDYGRTTGYDFQTSFFGTRYSVDLFAQYYQGFFSEKIVDDVSDITLRPDLNVFKVGASGQYIFNANKFSYRSSFASSEVQRKSAGGMLLGGNIFYNVFHYDNAIHDFDTSCDQTLCDIQFGPTTGYGYTVVFRRNFYTTLAPTIGVNIDFSQINGGGYNKISAAPFVCTRLACGYNNETWSLLVTAVYQQYFFFSSDKLSVQFADLNARLTFIRRFKYENRTLSKISRKMTFQRSQGNW